MRLLLSCVIGVLAVCLGCSVEPPPDSSGRGQSSATQSLEAHGPVVQAPKTAAPQPLPKAPPPGSHYRVMKTDTPKSIAVKFYGDERYAEDITALNKEAIRQARGLKPGMVIALPPVKERSGAARQ